MPRGNTPARSADIFKLRARPETDRHTKGVPDVVVEELERGLVRRKYVERFMAADGSDDMILHRLDGPAIVEEYQNGDIKLEEFWREDKPYCTDVEPFRIEYNRQFFQNDLTASSSRLISTQNSWVDEEGELHRDNDKPAVETFDKHGNVSHKFYNHGEQKEPENADVVTFEEVPQNIVNRKSMIVNNVLIDSHSLVFAHTPPVLPSHLAATYEVMLNNLRTDLRDKNAGPGSAESQLAGEVLFDFIERALQDEKAAKQAKS